MSDVSVMPMLGRPMSLGGVGASYDNVDADDDDLEESRDYEFVDDSELLLNKYQKDVARLSREESRE